MGRMQACNQIFVCRRHHHERFVIGADVVAERASDLPWTCPFSDEADIVEVVYLAGRIFTNGSAPNRTGEADIKRTVGVPCASDEL